MNKRKAPKNPLECPPWWRQGFVPCACRDPSGMVGGRFGTVFMLAPTFEGTLAVNRIVNMPGHIGVRDRIIPSEQVKFFTVLEDEESALQSLLLELKVQMLTEGATREAVRLVGEFIPITDKEYKIMADKLKTPAKKAPAAKATAAKAAPAKKAAPAAKADTGPDTRKITVLKKDHGARAGTKRAVMLESIYKAKTVQDAVDAGVLKSNISWAAREGYIKVA